MAATRDRGRNQPPVMKLGIPIHPAWQDKIATAARVVAMGLWVSAGQPATGDRAGVRDKVIAAARAQAELGVASDDLGVDERMASPAGVFRLVVRDFDWADPTVAESIMVLIERAVDAELARALPGRI